MEKDILSSIQYKNMLNVDRVVRARKKRIQLNEQFSDSFRIRFYGKNTVHIALYCCYCIKSYGNILAILRYFILC